MCWIDDVRGNKMSALSRNFFNNLDSSAKSSPLSVQPNPAWSAAESAAPICRCRCVCADAFSACELFRNGRASASEALGEWDLRCPIVPLGCPAWQWNNCRGFSCGLVTMFNGHQRPTTTCPPLGRSSRSGHQPRLEKIFLSMWCKSRRPFLEYIARSTSCAMVMLATALAPVDGISQGLSTSITAPYRVVPNITYLTANGFDARLDVYARTDPGGPFPTLMWFHGGGWVGGNKETATFSLLP